MRGGEDSISKTIIFFGSSLSFILGITLASFVPILSSVSEFWYFGLFLFVSVWLITIKTDKKVKIALLMAIFLFLGVWRYVKSIPEIGLSDVSYYNGERVEIGGIVVSDISRKNNKQSFELSVNSFINKDKQELRGKILVYSGAYPEYEYGDEFLVNCELQTPEPFEGFAYDRYLAVDEIYSICYYPSIKLLNKDKGNYFFALINKIKNNTRSIIDRGLGEPESSLARALILGDSKIIDNDLRANFSRSGISHIIAISGLHIGIIAGIIAFVLFRIGFGRNVIFYLSSIILFLFIILVGAPSSALRAGLMVVLGMYALKIGRVNKIDRVIIVAGVILLFINPKLLRDDISFQLSFSAVLGIVYIYPIINHCLEKIKFTNKYKIRDIMNVTISAQIATGGLAVYYFGVIPALGIVANLLILWILPFLLIAIIIAIALSTVLAPQAFIFFLPTKLAIDYIVLISDFVSTLPFSYFEKEVNGEFTLVYYSLLIFIVLFSNNKEVNSPL